MSRKIVLVIWGLLSFFFVQADESRARWITAFENQSASNTWLCFRKDIHLNSRPSESVTLKIAADSKYWMWINGRLAVFEGAVKRGPTPEDTYYDTVDVTSFLQEG